MSGCACVTSVCCVICRMELCHISDSQLTSQLRNSSDNLELISPACGVYCLQPYRIYGTLHIPHICYLSLVLQVNIIRPTTRVIGSDKIIKTCIVSFLQVSIRKYSLLYFIAVFGF